MYFPRNWEFGSALSKLRNNFGAGGGFEPTPLGTPVGLSKETLTDLFIRQVGRDRRPEAPLCVGVDIVKCLFIVKCWSRLLGLGSVNEAEINICFFMFTFDFVAHVRLPSCSH
jgi:hypothetical protein